MSLHTGTKGTKPVHLMKPGVCGIYLQIHTLTQSVTKVFSPGTAIAVVRKEAEESLVCGLT